MPGSEGRVVTETVGRLMAAYRQGDRQAAGELVEMFYPQLRRLAASRLRTEPSGHSWQPTLLVNELYLELIKIKALKPPSSEGGGDERAAFFGLAGLLMKRLLIHHARPLSRRVDKLELGDGIAATPGLEAVAEMETVLSRLEAIRPRLRTVVELRVFEGLTAEEIAARLECAPSTVARDWSFAKHWLQRQLARQAP